jgi:hypothetical protein
MSGCALRRFQGTPAPERPPNTENSKQLETALERMKREREEQNARFFPPPVSANTVNK